jgi:5-methylthioadenosine/S-adenosylhomocysteine deaminase
MTGQIVYAKYMIPAGAVASRENAVYIEGDRIIDVASREFLAEKYPDAEQFGGDHLIMLPGFVNAHDHGRAIGTQSLGIPDSILEVWLQSLGNAPTLPPYLAAAWEGLQLIKSGVTSTAHSHNPRSWETQFEEIPPTLRGYADAGVRVAMHPVIVDQNPLVYGDLDKFLANMSGTDNAYVQEQVRLASQLPTVTADEYFAELTQLYDQYHDVETRKVHIQASPAGGQWCSDELIMQAVEWAKARNTRVQMHMLETRYQRTYAFKTWGKSFIQHLDDIGALGEWLTLAHMVWVEPEDIRLVSEKDVCVVHNPSSNLRLRSGRAPFTAMKNAGIWMGIGMDGHTLDEDQDYLREMRLAYTLGSLDFSKYRSFSETDCIFIGTTVGAMTAFERDSKLSYLTRDAFADLVLLDWDAIRGPYLPDDRPPLTQLPNGSIEEFFLRRANKSHVRHVMMGGEWMLRDGKHTRLDEDALAAEIKEALSSQPIPPRHSILRRSIEKFYEGWDTPPEK